MANLGMKSFVIRDRNSVLDHDNNVMWLTTPQNVMYLNWKFKPNNYEQITPSSQLADACITPNSAQFDQDILISIGWADGFGIRKLLDDGTLLTLFTDAGPVGYSGGHNIAIDKVNHRAYVGAYPVNGTEIYDYSGVMSGGTTTPTSLGVYTKAANDMPADRAGSAYFNGFAIAGDYLYMGDYSSRSTVARWHIPTETDTSLPVINAGSNGYRGRCVYEEELDRMWILNNQNSGPWVVLSASTSGTTALAYRVPIASFLGGADITSFMAVAEEDNSNHVWLASGYGRIAKFDISPSITGAGGNPTVLEYNPGFYNYDCSIPPGGMQGYHSFSKHPKYGSKLIIGYADRAYNSSSPWWYDKETKRGMAKWYNYGVNPEISGGYDYGLPGTTYSFNVQYAGGVAYGTPSGSSQEYMVYFGYSGSHGHRYRTYNADLTPFDFEDEGYMTFGLFTLKDDEDIGSILIEDLYANTLTGTSFEVFVTNNTGTSWEQYNYNSNKYHIFNRRGNVVMVKFVLKTTLPYKSPNINSREYPVVTIRGFDPLELPSKSNKKINRIKGNINT